MNKYKRYLIALSAYKAGGGHIPSCYSCIDLISSIYEEYIMKCNKYEFVLSKGHAALALYATLAYHSIIPEEDKKLTLPAIDKSRSNHGLRSAPP